MAQHKLILDDDTEEDFSLLALHCSEEDYKMAFLLNKHLGLRLEREKMDLDFSNEGLVVTFPIFYFESDFQYTTYYLVANKCKTIVTNLDVSGGLFETDIPDKILTTCLLPEYKKVDFFLKIQSEFENIPLRKIIASINQIKQVISAYEVDAEQIKSKRNLIFD